MPTVFMTRGLPASGKSTWAHAQVAARPGQVVEVTKDQLRLSPQAPQDRSRERWVLARRDEIVHQALAQGKDVIVHDTGFNPVHARRLSQIAAEHGAAFEIVDFPADPVTCIERDAARDRSVGAHVIWQMWQRYVYCPPSSQPGPLPPAVLVDLDGTLARMRDRGPFDWDRVGQDEPVAHVVGLVRALAAAGNAIVYLSGRDGSCRQATQAWLDEHVQVPGPLVMRPQGDMRKDALVKAELYAQHVQGRYAVQFVLDDRDQVVHMWRTVARVPCLQVDYGAF